MSRGYWAGVMVVSIVVSAVTGVFLYRTLKVKQAIEVPLRQVKAEKNPPVTTPVTTTVNVSTGSVLTSSVTTPSQVKPTLNKSGKETVVFTYRNPTAKKVAVVGDFTKWYRKPMTKKDGVWHFSVPLAPGTYEYKFVVDSKLTKDPSNKNFKDKNSVITVPTDSSH